MAMAQIVPAVFNSSPIFVLHQAVSLQSPVRIQLNHATLWSLPQSSLQMPPLEAFLAPSLGNGSLTGRGLSPGAGMGRP